MLTIKKKCGKKKCGMLTIKKKCGSMHANY